MDQVRQMLKRTVCREILYGTASMRKKNKEFIKTINRLELREIKEL